VARGISIVTTVLNDRDGLAELLPALAAQLRQADEVVIVDAGSSDATDDILEYWRGRGLALRVLEEPGVGISAGRNRGIADARNEWIAITDAGCRPCEGWLDSLTRELERSDFVAGTYAVDRDTPFEHAVSVSLYPDVAEARHGVGPLASAWQRLFGRSFDVDRATGRSMAFTRACWRAVGGFPENVNAGEDVAFSRAAAAAAARSALAADATVAWRGRTSWRANAAMYWSYAEGDAIVGMQPRALARGAAWAIACALALGGGRRGRIAVAAGAGIYSYLPAARAQRSGLAKRHWWRIPALLAMKDVAMLGGSVSGLLARPPGSGRDVDGDSTRVRVQSRVLAPANTES
jgi:GT2 family glycosyltransferase